MIPEELGNYERNNWASGVSVDLVPMEGEDCSMNEEGRQDILLSMLVSTCTELSYPLIALSRVDININQTVNSP